MLRTATAQKFTSTKIYDLLIGLGAEKKKAEIAIGEFVELVPKALASSTTETGLDATLPTDKGDIWRLESIISENKSDTDIKLKEIEGKIIESKSDTEKIITKNRNDLEKIITDNRNDLEKIITDNRNDLEKIITKNRTDLEKTIAKIESNLKETIAKNKSDTDLKISESRVQIIKWVIATTLTSTGILIVIIFGLLQFLKVVA